MSDLVATINLTINTPQGSIAFEAGKNSDYCFLYYTSEDQEAPSRFVVSSEDLTKAMKLILDFQKRGED